MVETHPRHLDTLTAILHAEIRHPGVSVVIGVRECIVAARKRKAYERRLKEGGEAAPDSGPVPTTPGAAVESTS